jgi:hypothetical protein
VYLVAFSKQQLSQQRPVLAGNPGDQRSFHGNQYISKPRAEQTRTFFLEELSAVDGVVGQRLLHYPVLDDLRIHQPVDINPYGAA